MTEYVWDKETALKRVRGKSDRLARLVTIFLESMPDRFEKMEAAVAAVDAGECSQLAHAIKGVAGNLGGDILQRLSGAAELAAMKGDMTTVAEVWPQMKSANEALLVELRTFLDEVGE